MAKDDRRKTFAAKESKDSAANRDNDQRGRRQTTGIPVVKRTNNNAQRKLLGVEKLRDESKLKPPKLKDYHEAIQGISSTRAEAQC